jgi:hypothetical protein
LKAAAQELLSVTSIVTNQCLHYFQIDLIDFTTIPDSDYNWVIQRKDPFNKNILLEGLPDKTAKSVANIIEY